MSVHDRWPLVRGTDGRTGAPSVILGTACTTTLCITTSDIHTEYTCTYGAIQVLRNADVGGGMSNFPEKRYDGVRFNVIYRYEGVGGGPISRKKRYVTLELPPSYD